MGGGCGPGVVPGRFQSSSDGLTPTTRGSQKHTGHRSTLARTNDMTKERSPKKETKKKSAMNLKEKRAAKKAKQGNKSID